jgi:hypothetical protein
MEQHVERENRAGGVEEKAEEESGEAEREE